MIYKIWASVEAIDEDQDIYEDVAGPVCIGECKTQEDAEQAVALFNSIGGHHG